MKRLVMHFFRRIIPAAFSVDLTGHCFLTLLVRLVDARVVSHQQSMTGRPIVVEQRCYSVQLGLCL